MASLGVVLDACVLIPGCLRDTLLRAAQAGLFRVQWSEETVTEVRRNLVEDGLVVDEVKAAQLVGKMQEAFPLASVPLSRRFVQTMPNHPEDRHVLAAAVASQDRMLVTFNLRHFPVSDLAPRGVEALDPDAFLTLLCGTEPSAMVRIIRKQAQALRKPQQTALQVLGTLSKHAPTFVEMVRTHFAS